MVQSYDRSRGRAPRRRCWLRRSTLPRIVQFASRCLARRGPGRSTLKIHVGSQWIMWIMWIWGWWSWAFLWVSLVYDVYDDYVAKARQWVISFDLKWFEYESNAEVIRSSDPQAAGQATCPVRKLSCGHQFHHACIAQWLLRNASCPLCKSATWPHGAGAKMFVQPWLLFTIFYLSIPFPISVQVWFGSKVVVWLSLEVGVSLSTVTGRCSAFTPAYNIHADIVHITSASCIFTHPNACGSNKYRTQSQKTINCI